MSETSSLAKIIAGVKSTPGHERSEIRAKIKHLQHAIAGLSQSEMVSRLSVAIMALPANPSQQTGAAALNLIFAAASAPAAYRPVSEQELRAIEKVATALEAWPVTLPQSRATFEKLKSAFALGELNALPAVKQAFESSGKEHNKSHSFRQKSTRFFCPLISHSGNHR